MKTTRQQLARHAHNGGRGSIDLETSNVAALTFDAAERLDARVTDLARGAINTAPEFSVKNDRAADPGAQREADYRLAVARRASPHLAQRRGIRIVLKQHLPAECGVQR